MAVGIVNRVVGVAGLEDGPAALSEVGVTSVSIPEVPVAERGGFGSLGVEVSSVADMLHFPVEVDTSNN